MRQKMRPCTMTLGGVLSIVSRWTYSIASFLPTRPVSSSQARRVTLWAKCAADLAAMENGTQSLFLA